MRLSPIMKMTPPHLASVLIAVFLSVALAGCVSHSHPPHQQQGEPHHALAIDAGSSGSRIYIYRVESGIYGNIPKVSLLGEKKVKPGISEWEADPERARKNLASLLAYAKEKIDITERKATPLYLMATAGMRILSSSKREKTMKEIESFFMADNSFDFKGAVVISGAYEGLYSWIAANYLDDLFDPTTTREGIIEMGGASTQIAFVPAAESGNPPIQREFRGKTYNIFAKSYLYMGAEQARKLAGSTNCYPVGYPTAAGDASGTGDFDLCANEVVEQFTALCENLEQGGPHCIFKTGFSPPIQKDFSAISAFYYTFDFLGLEDPVRLEDLRKKADDFCAKDWNTLKKQYPKMPEEYLKSYCFNSAYFWSLLAEGYHFGQDTGAIRATEKINGTEISWTLGALIDTELGHAPARYRAGE